MAALLVKKAPGGGISALQAGNPGAPTSATNSRSMPVNYPLAQGQIYGINPALMRAVMLRKAYEQQQRNRAVAEALQRGWQAAKQWHDERRDPAPAVANAPTATAAVPVSGSSTRLAVRQNGASEGQGSGRGSGMIRFRDSQGGVHEIPQESLGQAWRRDPRLKVIAG